MFAGERIVPKPLHAVEVVLTVCNGLKDFLNLDNVVSKLLKAGRLWEWLGEELFDPDKPSRLPSRLRVTRFTS